MEARQPLTCIYLCLGRGVDMPRNVCGGQRATSIPWVPRIKLRRRPHPLTRVPTPRQPLGMEESSRGAAESRSPRKHGLSTARLQMEGAGLLIAKCKKVKWSCSVTPGLSSGVGAGTSPSGRQVSLHRDFSDLWLNSSSIMGF